MSYYNGIVAIKLVAQWSERQDTEISAKLDIIDVLQMWPNVLILVKVN